MDVYIVIKNGVVLDAANTSIVATGELAGVGAATLRRWIKKKGYYSKGDTEVWMCGVVKIKGRGRSGKRGKVGF